jgi:hypothetical protein
MDVFICVTSTGDTNLGPNFEVYSNLSNFSAIIATIPVASVTGANCPFLLAGVPDGTTILRLVDPTSGCCIDVPASAGFNLCEICEPEGSIDFSDKTTPNVGRISVGQLTGGCDPSFSNYFLEWYGPGTANTTNMVFTSSFGINQSGPSSFTHPLTGLTSPLLPAGQYRPIIKELEIDGTNFSWSYGAYGDCFVNKPLVVLPYTINNGSGTGDYEHEITFSSSSPNGIPTQSGTIQLSASTNFVPFRFQGGNVKDQLYIYFSGVNHNSQKLLLENILVGQTPNVNTTFQTSTFPKYAPNSDGFYTRVLCLTGLTRNGDNDVLLFDIVPYQPQDPTQFQFWFTQLPTFDCTSCLFDSPQYKLSAASFSSETTTCGNTKLTFSISGCSIGIDDNKDLYKYIFKSGTTSDPGFAYGPNGIITQELFLGDIQSTSCRYSLDGQEDECQCLGYKYLSGCTGAAKLNMYVQTRMLGGPGVGGQIGEREVRLGWKKTVVGCESASQLYTDILNQFSYFQTNYPQINDINDINFMNVFQLTLPNALFQHQLEISCKANALYTFFFAWNTVTWSTFNYIQDGNEYYGFIVTGSAFDPQDVINFENGTTFTNLPCSDGVECSGSTGQWQQINDLILSQSPADGNGFRWALDWNGFPPIVELNDGVPITQSATNAPENDPNYCKTTTGMGTFPLDPFTMSVADLYSAGAEPGTLTAVTDNVVKMYQYQLKTYPSTGSSYSTLVQNLSANTCSSLTGKTYNPYTADTTDYRSSYWKYSYLYKFVVTDDTGPNVIYNIFSQPINNGIPSVTSTLIATGTGSTLTIIDSSYFTP